jgi:transposase InsO family protein
MPWEERKIVERRMRFVLDIEEGDNSMTELCTYFGISRKTGYKWLDRYRTEGAHGLEDRSREHHRHPATIADEIVDLIIEMRHQHPSWGPKKLKALMERRYPNGIWPAPSTIGKKLKIAGLTSSLRRRSRIPPYTQPYAGVGFPNATWCADYKGWFRTGDRRRCEPLTLTDGFSRFLLCCEALSTTRSELARPVFEKAFRENGLPDSMRTDNGVPFAVPGRTGLSRLSVWWLKLGIMPERIETGHPEQNGRHERFHLTLKREATQPARENLEQQQKVFDTFRQEYNNERPHEALGMQTPAECYRSSSRSYPDKIPAMEYPAGFVAHRIQSSGKLKWRGTQITVSRFLTGEIVGLEQHTERYWKIHFGRLPLLWLDGHERKLLALGAREVLSAINRRSSSPSMEGDEDEQE